MGISKGISKRKIRIPEGNLSVLPKIKISEGALSILPVIIILIFIRFYPMISAIYRSFTNWNGLFRSDWIGLDNYIEIFTNSPFWTLLRNSLVLLMSVPFQL